jgi:hypothetical protein
LQARFPELSSARWCWKVRQDAVPLVTRQGGQANRSGKCCWT